MLIGQVLPVFKLRESMHRVNLKILLLVSGLAKNGLKNKEGVIAPWTMAKEWLSITSMILNQCSSMRKIAQAVIACGNPWKQCKALHYTIPMQNTTIFKAWIWIHSNCTQVTKWQQGGNNPMWVIFPFVLIEHHSYINELEDLKWEREHTTSQPVRQQQLLYLWLSDIWKATWYLKVSNSSVNHYQHLPSTIYQCFVYSIGMSSQVSVTS